MTQNVIVLVNIPDVVGGGEVYSAWAEICSFRSPDRPPINPRCLEYCLAFLLNV